MALFDVAEQCDAAHDPVVRVDGGSQRQRSDVREVGATRLLVHGTLVELRLPATTLFQIDREDVHDRQRSVQHLGRLLHQTSVATVPPGTVQKQTVNVHTCHACTPSNELLYRTATQLNSTLSYDFCS